MNNNVIVVVEGPTEEKFIKQIVAPYLLTKSIYIMPIVLLGDVSFDRVKTDVINSLKNKKAKAVSYFVDYYGLQDWPQKEMVQSNSTPWQTKRLEGWKKSYKKTVDGIDIAEKIGLSVMREKCPLFDKWLTAIETL